MKKHVKNCRNANRLNWQIIHQLWGKLVLPLLLWGVVAVSMANGQCSCQLGGINIGVDPTSVTTLTQAINNYGLPAGGANGLCITVNGRLKVLGNVYTFDGCTITMNDGAEILVENNSTTLTIKNSTVQGCQTMWTGISLKENGHLVLENNTIKDAKYAVNMAAATSIKSIGTTYSENLYGLYVNLPTAGSAILLTGGSNGFKDNTFISSSNLLPPYSGQRTVAGIYLSRVSNFQIGNNSNGNLVNTFNGLHHGIIDHYGFINRYSGCIMQNMSAQYGAGVYATNNTGTITVKYCTMTNVHTGIRAFNNPRKVEILNNSITYNWKGVDIDEKGCREINIKNNTFTSSANLSDVAGVYIAKATNGIYPIEISGNSFNSRSGSIRTDNVNGKLNVQNNTINLVSAFQSPGHIQTNLCMGPTLIKGNSIAPNNLSGSANIGINLINSKNAQVTENNLTGNGSFSTGNSAYGIYSSFSTGQLFCCNNLNRWWAGNWFQGTCTDTKLRNTTYGAHNSALYLYQSKISQQPNNGNTWAGSNINTVWDAVYSGDATIISQSKFLTKSSLIPNGYAKILVPFGASPTDWFTFTGNDPTCADWTNCGEPIFGVQNNDPNEFNSLTPTDLDALNAASSNDAIAQVLKWEDQRYLYYKLVHNPTLINYNSAVSNFYNNAQTGLIGKFYAVEDGIRKLDVPPTNLSSSYNALLDSLETINSNIESINEQLETATGQQAATLEAQRDDYIAQTGQLTTQLESVQSQIAADRAIRLSQLQTDNAAITTTTAYQSYQKTAFEIYLSTVAADNYIFTESQQTTLSNISAKCPSTDGVGVFWARYLRNYYEPVWVQPLDECGELATREQTQSPDIKLTSRDRNILYPNPANGLATISLSAPMQENGLVMVYDLQGRLVNKVAILPGGYQIDIPTEKLTNGFYTIKIVDRNGVVDTLKLAVTH